MCKNFVQNEEEHVSKILFSNIPNLCLIDYVGYPGKLQVKLYELFYE